MKQYLLVVKDSGVHGKGLFAGEDIPARKRLIEYVGEWISTDEANLREIENDKKGATYIFWYNYHNSIDGAVGGNDSIYINHCCDPNCEPYKKKKEYLLGRLKISKRVKRYSWITRLVKTKKWRNVFVVT